MLLEKSQRNLGDSRNMRCGRVPDEPGVEMQHDTSPYTITMDGKQVRVVASLLYFHY